GDAERLGGARGQPSRAQRAQVAAQALGDRASGPAQMRLHEVVDEAERTDTGEERGFGDPSAPGRPGGGAEPDERSRGEAHLASGEVAPSQLLGERAAHPSPPPSEGCAAASSLPVACSSPALSSPCVSGSSGRRSSASLVVP